MPESVASVLLVEDSAADAVLLRRGLERAARGPVAVRHVSRIAEALRCLADDAPDVVLLDLGLPDAQGLEGVRAALAAAPGVPIVVLTGLDDEALAERALQEGAQDYIVKGTADGELMMRALRYAMLRHRMRVEAERLRAEQLALKDEFLSHVSHELRSPLAVIHQFTSILQDGLAGELAPQQREYLGIVIQNAEQLDGMIEDLLEITRAQVGKLTTEPQCMSLGEAVRKAVAAFGARAAARGIELAARVEPDVPSVHADPRRVQQVLANLLDNALKFTPAGGAVVVGVAPEAGSELVRCWVADTGCGLAPDDAGRVFERHYQVGGATTASRKGLGLGLYISRELVERQGGRLTVESAPGRGSTFAFTLPAFAPARLVAPLLAARAEPLASLGVLEVVLDPRREEGTPGEWDRLVRDAYRVVERCVLPDLDVLLPRMRGPGKRERLFVVAAADERGTAVLERRLREQLVAMAPLADGRLRAEVTVHTLALDPWDGPAGRDRAVAALAPRLEALLQGAGQEGDACSRSAS